MKMKEKFLKQKQNADRLISSVGGSQIPMLKFECEYQSTQTQQLTHRQYGFIRKEKKNFNSNRNMLSSKSSLRDSTKNIMRTEEDDSLKFRTQQGFEPMMIKSRFVPQHENDFESAAVYNSSQSVAVYTNSQSYASRKDNSIEDRLRGSYEQSQNGRPLTFGLVRKVEPMKSSVEYREDVRMKNQVLSQLRNSQESLIASKNYSASGLGQYPRCINHNNKKAKYRLVADLENKDEEMIYCSKCTINLLQQGFKVQELYPQVPMMSHLSKSQKNFATFKSMTNSVTSSSRLQDMREFQQKLNDAQNRITLKIQENANENNGIEQIERQQLQTQSIFDQMIAHLQKAKESELFELNEKKNKRIASLKRHQEELQSQLQSVTDMKNEMKEFRNKFIAMKESEFRFLINSFQNKINNYGSNSPDVDILSSSLEEQVENIIQGLSEMFKNIGLKDDVFDNENQVNRSKESRVQRDSILQEDEFICREMKGPFRTLFPEESSPGEAKEGEDERSPSFSKGHNDTFETMQRSVQSQEHGY